MSRTALLAAAVPAAAVLGFAAQNSVAAETAAVFAVASVCWYGPKTALERRFAVPVAYRPAPGPGRRRAQTDTMPERPRTTVPETIEQPHRDVATAEEHQALAEALEHPPLDATQRIPRADPYRYPAEGAEEMTPDQALVFVEQDLAARGAWYTSSGGEYSYSVDEAGESLYGDREWTPVGT